MTSALQKYSRSLCKFHLTWKCPNRSKHLIALVDMYCKTTLP